MVLLLLLLLLKVLPLLLLLKPAALGGDTRPANGCSSESTPCCKPLNRSDTETSRAAAAKLITAHHNLYFQASYQTAATLHYFLKYRRQQPC
jgi:hypothetical protein